MLNWTLTSISSNTWDYDIEGNRTSFIGINFMKIIHVNNVIAYFPSYDLKNIKYILFLMVGILGRWTV